MTVRAKFYIDEVTKTASGDTKVKLKAVCRGEDNKTWSKYTPWGTIEMGVLNEAAAEQFVPGDEVYVDFIPAPKGQEG